ncbi:hypothetical protein MIND_00263700 [Mycena indigotica]|uniref:Small RNA 2'-O-methyltransferase n=1 Tax=Mycena indigotica TaxID=2126181 RepID=A0A8H6T5K5_9AGAR|nr:uncharacterized protein MIND_00263700 [Mycena indigotica]KAF7312500.1 hypothetical protein MIND_00263700 [Mycena indigotica]
MGTMAMAIPELEEHDGDHEEIELDIGDPKVHFYPPLHLQRRIWILDILRRENIVELLDVGCGEGQLLSVLAQPAPWLLPPPETTIPSGEAYTYKVDNANLHMQRVVGIDISETDLAFAVKDTQPQSEDASDGFGLPVTRFEKLSIKLFKGGLQTFNEEFVGIDCIVCTEVIEHLPPEILPTLAPMLLGMYNPRRLLITTPSYTFNARFTRPSAPRSQRERQGYPDPTGRTDRIFRHSDHKFEWTVEEFQAWCRETAESWDYELEEMAGVGRPLEDDPWGRDQELGDASLVVSFIRKDHVSQEHRVEKARSVLAALSVTGDAHELLAEHQHIAHSSSGRPAPALAIADKVKAKMEELREAIIPLEQIWFDPAVSTLCGGYIEALIWAVEESELLNVLRAPKEWSIELVGGVTQLPDSLWAEDDPDSSLDLIPDGWIPGQDPDEVYEEEDDDTSSLSTTGADGNVSWSGSQFEEEGHETVWAKDAWDERNAGWGEEAC